MPVNFLNLSNRLAWILSNDLNGYKLRTKLVGWLEFDTVTQVLEFEWFPLTALLIVTEYTSGLTRRSTAVDSRVSCTCTYLSTALVEISNKSVRRCSTYSTVELEEAKSVQHLGRYCGVVPERVAIEMRVPDSARQEMETIVARLQTPSRSDTFSAG